MSQLQQVYFITTSIIAVVYLFLLLGKTKLFKAKNLRSCIVLLFIVAMTIAAIYLLFGFSIGLARLISSEEDVLGYNLIVLLPLYPFIFAIIKFIRDRR